MPSSLLDGVLDYARMRSVCNTRSICICAGFLGEALDYARTSDLVAAAANSQHVSGT